MKKLIVIVIAIAGLALLAASYNGVASARPSSPICRYDTGHQRTDLCRIDGRRTPAGPFVPNLTTTVFVDIMAPTSEGGWGTGMLVSNPTGIDCDVPHPTGDTICQAAFQKGSKVTLTAISDAGSRFASWETGGLCSGQTQSCTFTVPTSGSPLIRVRLDCFVRVGQTCMGSEDPAAGNDISWMGSRRFLFSGDFMTINTSGGQQPDTFTYACGNSDDDDGDGATDLADSGCVNTQDDDERNNPPPEPPAPPVPPPPPPVCGTLEDECDLDYTDNFGNQSGGNPTVGDNCTAITTIAWDRNRRPLRALTAGTKITGCVQRPLTISMIAILQKAHVPSSAPSGHGPWTWVTEGNGLWISLQEFPFSVFTHRRCRDTQTHYIFRVVVFWSLTHENLPPEAGTIFHPSYTPFWPRQGGTLCR